MKDLIERDAAILIVKKEERRRDMLNELLLLPSAETHEIRTETHGVCSDLISRANAIEAVAQQWLFEASVESPYVNDDDIGEYRRLAEKLFEGIPSAEAVQGEWIDVENEPYCECSVCGSYIDNLDDNYAFCPRCGARMKGGAE